MPTENAVIDKVVEERADHLDDDELQVESLIEDISIDGMCGVY